MPKPRRLEIRVTERIGALIDVARGDAKVQAWGERAFLQRLERDGFLGGSEQTVSPPGPSAAMPPDVPVEVEPEPASDPEPPAHDDPVYERRPPPRMTGGRRAQ